MMTMVVTVVVVVVMMLYELNLPNVMLGNRW